MNSFILIEIILLLYFKTVSCSLILRYVDQQKPWQDASNHCTRLNGYLFSTTIETLYSLFRCGFNDNVTYPIWTGRFKSLSALIEIQGCFDAENIQYSRTVTYDGENITEYDCQQYCQKDTFFAQGLNGECHCNVTNNELNGHLTCRLDRTYRVYKVVDENVEWDIPSYFSKRPCCLYTTCTNSMGSACQHTRQFHATECNSPRNVICKTDTKKNSSLSWCYAKSFCNKENTMMWGNGLFTSHITDTWIGVSRNYAYTFSESVPTPDPIDCFVYYKNRTMEISSCNTSRTFVCAIEINNENNRESGDCNVTTKETTIQSTTKSGMSSTEYSTTVPTDYKSGISTSEYFSHMTSTENQESPTSHFTENQESTTSNFTENQKLTTSYFTGNQQSTTENNTVSTNTRPSIVEKLSEQPPLVVIGIITGVVIIVVFVVVIVLVVLRQKKMIAKKYKKHDEVKETDKPTKGKTKGSPVPVGSSNVSGNKSEVYCDPWQSFDESQTLTNAGKKLNRQSHNPMYEMNSLQYDSYSVAGGLTKPNNTEKYENVNLDIYNHCNVGTSAMAGQQQNVYDSAAGIYSHLNHGVIKDHNEDTYDHFHGSDQDYDQFDRTLRNTEETEYSIYQ